jgi:hypothetical protein
MNRGGVTTRQPSPLTLALALAGVLLLVLFGVVIAALVLGDVRGAATGELGEVPAWMSGWLLVLGAFLAVILGWSIWLLAGWLGMWVTSRQRVDEG